MKNKILIFGASGHAKVIIDIIEKQAIYEIFGLIDSIKKKGSKIYDYTIVGTEDDLSNLIKTNDIFGGIIAIGDNWTRRYMYKKISSITVNFKFITAIHPNASVGKNVLIKSGTVIMPGSVINSDARIGKQCIINTKSSIGHDTIIKDFCSIAPGVSIGGHVLINKCSAISLGANIIEFIKIGKHSIIGAGSMVNKNIADYKIAYGIPAYEIRNRKKKDKYLGLRNIHETHTYSLELHKITNNKDEEKYNKIIKEFTGTSTFYNLQNGDFIKDCNLSYFLFKKNGKIKILLPICLNKISPDKIEPNNFFKASSACGFRGPLLNNTTDLEIRSFWKKVNKWYIKNYLKN